MSRLPRYIFDLCYNKKCIICKTAKIREATNRLLYDRYRDNLHDNNKVTFPYIRDYIESVYNFRMPSIPSIRRHYEGHFIYYLEHRSEISDILITEWTNSNKGNDKEEDEDLNNEIEIAFAAIEEGAKIYDVFPLTGYNSTTGVNNITGHPCEKLNWTQWSYRFLKVEVNHEFVPMVLPKHVADLLDLIDKYPGLLLLIARGHIKSTLLQIFTLRKMCDFQSRFLYIGGSKDEVIRYTENIRSELKENPIILHYYGYLPHPKRGDSKKGLYLRTPTKTFSHDPHLTFATPPKGSSGTSKLGGHSDYIVLDDIQGEDIKTSDKLKRKHENWFDRNIMPMRKGKTKIIIAGTRKDYDDIYNYIKIKRYLYTFEKPAIIKYPNGDKDEYKLITRDDGVQVWEGGQSDPVNGDLKKWCYHRTELTETVGKYTTTQFIVDGIENLRGGEVFWDEFRKEGWDDRPIKYYKSNGEYDKTLMTLQELLLEKGFLETQKDKGHFSFSSEYQLNPVETEGRHFDIKKIKHYDYDTWQKVVDDDSIPKFSWVDVGYSLPNEMKPKDAKKGKTVFCTAALVDPLKHKGFTPSQGGVYVLEVRSGNYFIQHSNPKYSLLAQILQVNDMYQPQVISFEDNFFGKYLRSNAELNLSQYHLPIDGKRNMLDKFMRISNGINARLSNTKFGLWLCKETQGYGALIRQIAEFPHSSKIDEIDALESCDRLLIRRSGRLVLIGGGDIFSHSLEEMTSDGVLSNKPLNPHTQYTYYRGRRRGFT